MTETVGLGLREEAPPEPVERKRPGLAWLLGSLLPGLGQAYVGKRTRAFITGLGFVFAAAIVLHWIQTQDPNARFIDNALRVTVFLYVFSFLDAFYTAREINSGEDAIAGDLNPRVAAVLNFLTNGLGYFYVGERRLGVIVLVVCLFGYRLASAAIEGVTNGLVLLAVVLAELTIRTLLSVDAYRRSLVQRRERLANTPLQPSAGTPAPHLEVPAAGPLAVAGVIVAAYLLFNILAAVALQFSEGE